MGRMSCSRETGNSGYVFFGGGRGGQGALWSMKKLVNDLLLGMFPCCLIIRENQFYSQRGIRALIAVA